MAKDSFIFHLENAEDLEDLTLEEQGMILNAMIRYSQTGEEPDFEDRALRSVWRPIFRRLKADKEAYEEKCQKNKEAAEKRWSDANASEKMRTHKTHVEKNAFYADSDSDSDTDTDLKEKQSKKKTAQRFSPPSVDEVRDYVHEKQYQINPQAFVDFYTSKGWRVGNQPMKDWKAAVRTWASRPEQKARSGTVKTGLSPGMQHNYDIHELARRAKA